MSRVLAIGYRWVGGRNEPIGRTCIVHNISHRPSPFETPYFLSFDPTHHASCTTGLSPSPYLDTSTTNASSDDSSGSNPHRRVSSHVNDHFHGGRVTALFARATTITAMLDFNAPLPNPKYHAQAKTRRELRPMVLLSLLTPLGYSRDISSKPYPGVLSAC